MIDQQKRNRITILGIFGLSFIPFGIAWYLSTLPPTKTTNNGELIIPVVTTEKMEFTGFDEFSQKNLNELTGHWLIVNVIPSTDCQQVCQEAIYKTKQLHLMLGKDLTRVRRIVLLFKETDKLQVQKWWQEDTRILKIKPADSLATKFTQIAKGQLADGALFLIDPLGNIMMQYKSGFDPYKVQKDLKKLLSVSQIG